ncbi:MAG: MFS transporter [Deltaproteobacteria bacterium]|nr:MFS transporter [Deltaproteobacteria bacterium]
MTEKECPVPEPFKSVIGSIVFLTLLFFLTFIGRFIFAPLMPSIVKDLGITPSQAGSIFLIASVGVFIGSMVSGFISSRINHRGNLVVSMLAAVGALITCTLFPTLWVIRGSMLVLGIAAGLNLPSNVATITAMVSRQDWGKALAVQQTAPPMSLVVGPLLVVLLLEVSSWKGPLLCIAGAAIGVGFILLIFGKFGDFPGDPLKPSPVRAVLRLRSFWIMVILFALGMGGQVGVYAMLPLYMVTERGMNAETANTLIGVAQISALFMTFLAGWITDRIGEKKAIMMFLIASGLVNIMLGLSSGLRLKVMVFLQPALFVCFFPAAFSALSRIVQPTMRSIAAVMAPPTAFVLGGGLFPAALGYMGEAYSFGLGIALSGAVIVAGSVLALSLQLLEKMEDGC